MPLVNKEGMPERAREVFDSLRHRIGAEYDQGGSIGKRYRRQDEIGTPWGVTIDGDTADRRHRHPPRPRLADPGAGPDRRPRRAPPRQARGGLAEPEAGVDAAAASSASPRASGAESAQRALRGDAPAGHPEPMAGEADNGCVTSNEKRASLESRPIAELDAAVSTASSPPGSSSSRLQAPIGASTRRASGVDSSIASIAASTPSATEPDDPGVAGWPPSSAGGPGAVLSHRPAGAEWNLRGWSGAAGDHRAAMAPSQRPRSKFTPPCSPPTSAPSATGSRSRTVPRTLLDLATVLDHDAPGPRAERGRSGPARRLPSPSPPSSTGTAASAAPALCGEALADVAFGRGVTRRGARGALCSLHRRIPPAAAAPQRCGPRRRSHLRRRRPLARSGPDRRAPEHRPSRHACGDERRRRPHPPPHPRRLPRHLRHLGAARGPGRQRRRCAGDLLQLLIGR